MHEIEGFLQGGYMGRGETKNGCTLRTVGRSLKGGSFRKLHFPVRLAFMMTTDIAQGQSLRVVVLN